MGEFNKDRYIFSSVPGILDISKKTEKLRENQISLMTKELFLYKVVLKDLVSHSPSYRDRNLILNIAYYIVEEIDIFERLQKRRELPMSIVARKTQVSRGFLELWQDYIITYVIIFSNPNYKYVQDYIRIEVKDEGTSVVPFNKDKKDQYKGIVIKNNKRSSIILTSAGEFTKVKVNDNVGKEVEGKEKRGIRHYKLQIAIVTVLILLSCFGVYHEYTKSVRTVVINISSQVKYDVNKFNKVIYAYSGTEKGKEMIKYTDPLDKSIDEALQKSIEYAKENKMISDDGVLLTVNGEPLKYGILKETGDYIVDKNINVLINNGGNQHKLYESALKQKEEKNEK